MINGFRNKSISLQLQLIIGLVVLLGLAAMASLVYNKASKALFEQAMVNHESKVQAVASLVAGQFASYLERAHDLEASFRNGYVNGLAVANREVDFQQFKVKDLHVRGASLVGNSRYVDRFTQDTSAVATLFSASGDDFVRVATSLKDNQGERAVGTRLGTNHPGYSTLISGKPYHAKVSLFGKEYLTYYYPLKNEQGKVAALSFIGVPIDSVTTEIFSNLSQIKWGDTGYTIVVDNNPNNLLGDYLLHPQIEAGNSIIDRTDFNGDKPFAVLFEQSSGRLIYPYQYQGTVGDKYLVFADVPGWNWKVLGGTFVSEVTKASHDLLVIILLVSVSLAVFVVIALSLFVRRMTKPIEELSANMQRMGAGEVSVKIAQGNHQSNNEVQRLTAGVNQMASKLNVLVGNIRATSEDLQGKSTSVYSDAESSLVQLDNQQAQVDQVAAAIEEMSSSAASVAEQVEDIANSVRAADTNSQQGAELVERMVSEIDLLNQQLHSSAEAIELVGKESNNIQDVTKMINDIADQTNLLALNAAIEAARAGEQGRGFAVVADEVRTLAQRTQESVKEVEDIIGKLQSSTNNAVTLMGESKKRGEFFTEHAAKTGEALNGITQQVATIASQSETIAATTEQQSQVSQEIAANASQISSLTNDSRDTAAQTASSATHLQSLSLELRQQMAQFS
ncbi:Cache 3/Cache 2 fusion domain-containing protein [Agarivorans sp. MS3-6]|uniref:methyl-accepting chemotaxis protein n=1 Tax=Agarivorans sp. TSD2052 TaxID=2937286 RepID=UPI002010A6A9|nr:Cache 3/Cache 2 fusion domain-containing protein [Agarivorans sp. TSD2052]UPW17481.1 methyl-accepting chemotaxis protein [Agarivorans sp. TSD2052]